MKILTQQNSLSPDISSVVTIGNFDGVHRGHSQLIARTAELARGRGAVSAVVTFEPHTRAVIHPELPTSLLTTFNEKMALIEKMGIDYVLCLNFDDNLRQMGQEKFIKTVLVDRLRTSCWVMGEGHRIGRNQIGCKKNLHFDIGKYHINMFVETLETVDGMAVSSTRIRKLISEGYIGNAMAMLGHPYLIMAERIEGVKIATGLGFPTLNFKCPELQKVIPPAGVYAAEIEIGIGSIDSGNDNNTCGTNANTNVNTVAQKITGALYFGDCPTYSNRETHFEFHALRYDDGDRSKEPAIGEVVRLWLYKYVRPDTVFSNPNALRSQIERDVNEIKKYFSEEMQ